MTPTASHEALDLVFFGIAASVQAAEEGNTSFLVRSAGATALVDASGSPHQNLLRAGSSCTDVDAVVLTHAHTDHIYALPSILHQAWLLKRTKPLTLLGLPATLGVARELGEALDLWRRDWSFELRWQEVDHDSVWSSGDLSLEFFRVDHGGHPTIGIGIAAGTKRVVYSCDTGPSDEVFRRALGADWLIHEAGNGSEPGGKPATPPASFEFTLPHRPSTNGHSSVREAAAIAEQAGVARLFLCHVDFTRHSRGELTKEASELFTGEILEPRPFEAYRLDNGGR